MRVGKQVPCVVFFLFCLAALPAAAQSNGKRSGEAPLVGAWYLVELDSPDAGGQIHGVDCSGLLIFTSDGHLSLQVMERNPKMGQRPIGGDLAQLTPPQIATAVRLVIERFLPLVRFLPAIVNIRSRLWGSDGITA